MSDPIEHVARAAATHLAAEFGPGLPMDVERALHNRDTTSPPDQYFDPVAIGSLIVAITALVVQVYTGLKTKTQRPPADVVTRTVRVRLEDAGILDTTQNDRIIQIVVNETIAHADPQD